MSLSNRIDADTLLYKGVKIERDDSVPTGYWGRYRIAMFTLEHGYTPRRFTSLKEAKDFVDSYKATVSEEKIRADHARKLADLRGTEENDG